MPALWTSSAVFPVFALLASSDCSWTSPAKSHAHLRETAIMLCLASALVSGKMAFTEHVHNSSSRTGNNGNTPWLQGQL